MKDILNLINKQEVTSHEKIPDLDLYVDQVTTFLDDNLKSFKRNQNDKAITKTMINNYTKSKVLKPPYKKKYSKDHLMLLILTYHMKSVLSIDDISKVINNKIVHDDLEMFYKDFIKLQEKEISLSNEEIVKKIEEMDTSENDETTLLLFVMSLLVESSTKKLLAEKIIDAYFK